MAELVDLYRRHPSHIVALGHNGVRGNPCLFPARFFPELRALREDQAAAARSSAVTRTLLLLYDVPARQLADVDTRAALDALRPRGSGRPARHAPRLNRAPRAAPAHPAQFPAPASAVRTAGAPSVLSISRRSSPRRSLPAGHLPAGHLPTGRLPAGHLPTGRSGAAACFLLLSGVGRVRQRQLEPPFPVPPVVGVGDGRRRGDRT